LRSLPAPARRCLLFSKRDQKHADREAAAEVVTVVGDVGRPWLSVVALPQPHDVPDAIDELLAANVALDKRGAQNRDDVERLPRNHASPATCMVIVRRADSRTVSGDGTDEPAVKPIGRLEAL
jgi:hypothetical protein